MKKLILAFAAILITATMFAQSASGKKAEEFVKFKELTYDFGKIKQGVPVTHDFYFSNVSAKPVIIESATASCGCTTPTWPQPPVAKGKTDKITAGFNAAAPGPFNKSVYVKVAGVETPLELKITGEVVSGTEAAKAPAKKS